MKRLLTEQGKQKARNDWHESSPTWDEEHHLLIAQDAKSVKVDRQAAAGWFMGICSEHKHAPLEHRIDCDECICELPELLLEGKAPWEAPQ